MRAFEAGKEKAKKELQESMEAEEAEKAAEEKIKMAREEARKDNRACYTKPSL